MRRRLHRQDMPALHVHPLPHQIYKTWLYVQHHTIHNHPCSMQQQSLCCTRLVSPGWLVQFLSYHRICNKVYLSAFTICGALEITTCSSSSSSANWPKTSPYRGSPASLTGGLPQPPAWYPNWVPGGMGAFRPGTCTDQR